MSQATPPLTRASISSALTLIQPLIHRTPLLSSRTLSASTGTGSNVLLFKAENLQRGGAFKSRGAFYNVECLTEEERRRGVCTHSSGNHASCLALAASSAVPPIPCHLIMPANSAAPKITASRAYGASITFCEPTATARQATCDRVQSETGATFVAPYDAERTIVGQGTVMLEIEEQVKELGYALEEIGAVVVPVGGGGLLAGVCLAAAEHGIPVYGAEPQGADDCFRGISSGKRIPDLVPQTIADGLRTPVGLLNFPIIKQHVRGIITVSEEEIVTSQFLLFSRLKSVVEPSGAVAFAAVRSRAFQALGIKGVVVMIVTGGNVDLEKEMPWVQMKG